MLVWPTTSQNVGADSTSRFETPHGVAQHMSSPSHDEMNRDMHPRPQTPVSYRGTVTASHPGVDEQRERTMHDVGLQR